MNNITAPSDLLSSIANNNLPAAVVEHANEPTHAPGQVKTEEGAIPIVSHFASNTEVGAIHQEQAEMRNNIGSELDTLASQNLESSSSSNALPKGRSVEIINARIQTCMHEARGLFTLKQPSAEAINTASKNILAIIRKLSGDLNSLGLPSVLAEGHKHTLNQSIQKIETMLSSIATNSQYTSQEVESLLKKAPGDLLAVLKTVDAIATSLSNYVPPDVGTTVPGIPAAVEEDEQEHSEDGSQHSDGPQGSGSQVSDLSHSDASQATHLVPLAPPHDDSSTETVPHSHAQGAAAAALQNLQNDPHFQYFTTQIQRESASHLRMYSSHVGHARQAETDRNWAGASIHWRSAAAVAQEGITRITDHQGTNNTQYHHPELTNILNDTLATWHRNSARSTNAAAQADVNARACCTVM